MEFKEEAEVEFKKMAFKRKSVPKAMKNQLWNQTYGRYVGCTYCPICEMNEIQQSDFEAGHIIAVAKGGVTTLDNLRAICKACNRSMGMMNMDEYQQRYYPRVTPMDLS